VVKASVTVPATSANLGPGFDSFGLALRLHNRFFAELAEEWSVEIAGEGEGSLPTGVDNDVARAMTRVFAEVGQPDLAASVRCENAVPCGEGLGSSAAAIVGGLLLADELVGAGLSREEMLVFGDELEGHPDNVAAALYGGFTLCWRDPEPRCVRIDPAVGLAAVIVRAVTSLSTSESRRLLPRDVPHTDAAFNVGRAGLLSVGIALGDSDALAAGLTDRIHEPYRLTAVPDFEDVRRTLTRYGADGAVLSGAGPTVIGIVAAVDDASAEEVARRVAAAAASAMSRSEARRAPWVTGIDRVGAVRVRGSERVGPQENR